MLEYFEALKGCNMEGKIIAKPKQENEKNLLLGHEFEELTINGDESISLKIKAPSDGWTYDKLETVGYDKYCINIWDAYLGSQWIGSSEV